MRGSVPAAIVDVMKPLLLVLISLMAPALAAGAGVQDALERAERKLLDMRCAAEARLATSVMRLRQVGAPMAAALGEEPSDRLRALVVRAYKAPRERTEAGRRRAAEEFGIAASLACYRENN